MSDTGDPESGATEFLAVPHEEFQCGDFTVEPVACRIHGLLGATHLRPKVMEVLIALARARGRVVSRQELVRDVWGGAFVSDAVVTNAIGELRRALNGAVPGRPSVETIPRRGYRLLLPVSQPHLATSPRRPQPVAPAARLSGSSAGEYRRARLLLRGSTYEQLERGLQAMREVVRREPRHALARTELARGCFLLASWGRDRGRDLVADIEEHAARAVQLDPEGLEPLLWSTMAQVATRWFPRQALWPLGRLLQRDPRHVATRDALAHCLAALGRLEEAVELQRRAVDEEPFSPALRTGLGFFLRVAGRLEEAEHELLTTLELHPSWSISRLELARVRLAQGRTHEACEDLQAVEPAWAELLSLVIRGDSAELARRLAMEWTDRGVAVAPYWLAERCMWAGEPARAMEALERAFRERQLHLLYAGVEPLFQPLRRWHRFRSLLDAIGVWNEPRS